MSRETCERIGSDPQTVRAVIEDMLRQSPELFPTGMVQGFGHDAHFGDRHVERLGHNSVVGTAVRDPNQLPDHLTADEHHTDGCGQKGAVSLTAGEGCVPGIALTPSASDEQLTQAQRSPCISVSGRSTARPPPNSSSG